MKILIIEDEEKIAIFLKEILEADKNKVTVCESIEEAYKHKYELTHDIVLLDLMLNGKPGIHLIHTLRKKNIQTPILVLSALSQINTVVEHLNAGADDYLTKPFNSEELKARIRTLYRRYLLQKNEEEKINVGDLTYSRKQNKASRNGKQIRLTRKEGELLLYLMENEGKTLRTSDILNRVWNTKEGFHSNILQATIKRLRRKIDQDHPNKLINNVHGVGYVISA